MFVTTTATDIKPNTCPAHGRHASVCKISPSYDAAFRKRSAPDRINKLSIIK